MGKTHVIEESYPDTEQTRKFFVGNLPYEADEGTQDLH